MAMIALRREELIKKGWDPDLACSMAALWLEVAAIEVAQHSLGTVEKP